MAPSTYTSRRNARWSRARMGLELQEQVVDARQEDGDDRSGRPLVDAEVGFGEFGEVLHGAAVARSPVAPCVGLRADAAQWGEEHTVLLGCRQGSLDEGAELALEGVLSFGDDASHRAIETSGFPVVQGGEQIVLVGEVLVEQGAGDSRSMGDGTHGDRAWTVLEHQHARDVEQRLATFVAGEPLTSVGNLLGGAHPQSLPRARLHSVTTSCTLR